MALSTVWFIALLAILSSLFFYFGHLTSITAPYYHGPSEDASTASSRRRLELNDDTSSGRSIIDQIQMCYNYNYFSDACIHDNHEIHRRVDEVLNPRGKSGNGLHNDAAGLQRNNIYSSFLTGSVVIPKKDLMDRFDKFGVATLHTNVEEDALLLYNSFDSLPSSDPNYHTHQRFATPYSNTTEALENCDALNVQFIHNPSTNTFSMCTLYIPGLSNLPSYHIQRWMRTDGKMQHVGSLTTPDGVNKFDLPKYHPVISKHWNALQTFLENVDRVLEDVDTIIKERFDRMGIQDATVIVMTVNRGDVDLLLNFICAAKSRKLDVRRILVFVTDEDTKQLIESQSSSDEDLGVMVYFDKQNLASVAKGGESQKFGDATFISMMFAKILCVLYPSLLGYDVLYQDVDIVWYDNPLRFFHDKHPKSSERLKDYDVIFQHDGSPQPRFSPYSANSGFYFVKSNSMTQYLFISMLYHGDLIRKTTSHQQVLTQLLLEHSSLLGIRVKVLDDTSVFPGGYQYQHDNEYMHQLISGDVNPLIFHMYWTDGKESKVRFLQQLGEWYVHDICSADLVAAQKFHCCSKEPIISCHYRDKPSKVPCLDSEPFDKHGISFW